MGVTCEHTPFLTSHLISSLPTAVLGEIKNVAAVVAKCSCSVFFLYCLVFHTSCSQAVVVDRTMYLSGQIGMSPEVSLNCCLTVFFAVARAIRQTHCLIQAGLLVSQTQTANCVSLASQDSFLPVTLLHRKPLHACIIIVYRPRAYFERLRYYL